MLVVNWDETTRKVESSSVSVDLEETRLSENEKAKFSEVLDEFNEGYFFFSDKPELTQIS